MLKMAAFCADADHECQQRGKGEGTILPKEAERVAQI